MKLKIQYPGNNRESIHVVENFCIVKNSSRTNFQVEVEINFHLVIADILSTMEIPDLWCYKYGYLQKACTLYTQIQFVEPLSIKGLPN